MNRMDWKVMSKNSDDLFAYYFLAFCRRAHRLLVLSFPEWTKWQALFSWDNLNEWPGNVRELQNTIQRFLVTNQITLPGGRSMYAEEEDEALSHEDGLNAALEDLERRLIQESLRKTVWNRGQAADFLKISRWTLQRKMLKYDLGKKEDQDWNVCFYLNQRWWCKFAQFRSKSAP